MIDRKIAKIKLKRGFESERKMTTFSEGELVYIIDTKRLYIGDGTTVGGTPISNKNYIISTDTIPSGAIEGDIMYQKTSDIAYILGYADSDVNKTTLIKFPIFTKVTYTDLQAKITELYAKIAALEAQLA
jgi:hypothetical protein